MSKADQAAKPAASNGLFNNWLELERKDGKMLKTTLEELNAATGRKYQNAWVFGMANRGVERIPTEVRQYMMKPVLAHQLERLGYSITPAKLEKLIAALT